MACKSAARSRMEGYVSAANDGKHIFAMLILIERSTKHVGLYDLLHHKLHGKELKVPVLPP